MSKFGEILKQAREGLQPWANSSRDSLAKVAPQMDNACVMEAIAFLNELSAERKKIEKETPWDGDATDGVHFQQEEVATLIELSKNVSRSEIAKGLQSEFTGTRFWIAYILSKSGDKTVLPELRNAIEQEEDQLIIKVINQAIAFCSRNPILRMFSKS